MDTHSGDVPQIPAWILHQQRHGNNDNRAQYGAGAHEYSPGITLNGVTRTEVIIQHHILWKNIIDLGGVWGGPKRNGTLGRILGESGSGHKE